MNKRLLSKLACIALVASMTLSIVACGKKTGSDKVDSQSGENTQKDTQKDTLKDTPAELSFWNIVDDPNNAMSKRFEAAYGQVEKDLGIKIKYDAITGQTYHTKIKVALAGNELPDMFVIHPGDDRDPFITSKAVAPLNDILDSSGLGKKFFEGYLPKAEDGNIYSVPFRADMIEVMFYNKEIFKDTGISVPKDWEEFKKACKAISDKGYFPIGLGNKDKWMGDLVYNTMVLREDPYAFEKALKGEMKFSDKPFLDAAKKVQELANMNAFQKGYMGAIEPEVVELFQAGKIGMYFNGTWAFTDLEERLGDNLGYAPFPAIGADEKPEESICGTRNQKPWGFMVSVSSKNVEKAKLAVVKFVDINNDLLVKEGDIPYMQTDVKSEKKLSPAFEKYIEDIKKIKFIQTYWADYLPKQKGEPYRDLNQTLFTGKIDPQKYVEQQHSILSGE